MRDPLEEASADVDRRGATFILIAFVVGIVALAIFNPGSRDALAIIFGIVVMVMLHEAGHFIAARRTGMKATEFFLGFGPKLWSFKRGETEYGVKAVPAGGYVRIIGMSNLETVEIDDEKRTYRRASYKHRLIVVLAGVTVNALIAFLLFWAYFAAQGTNELSPQISRVVKGSAAAAAGFENGDKFVAIDGTPIDTWDDFREGVEAHPGDPIVFTIIRDGERIDVEATPKRRDGKGFLGIAPSIVHRDVSFFGAVPESVGAMGDITAGTANGLAKLFSPSGISEYSKNFTGDAPEEGSRADAERPRSLIGIVDYGSDVINGDLWALLWLLASISLILALFNTLPLLPFDGGHAAIVLYEWVASKITRREVRVDFRKMMPVTAVVLAIFLTLGLSAMFLDIRNAVGS